jgi:DNA-binding LytR/AlgR family response regulator
MEIKMDVVIVEDEKWAARELEKTLMKLRPDNIQVVAKLENVSESVEWFGKHTADLVFMDVHLGDGNSFSIFEKVNLNIPIIFTTAFDQYALQAFKANSVDYLLKPVDTDDLELALQKYERIYQSGVKEFDYRILKESLHQTPKEKYQERFMVSAGERIRSIGLEEVAYFMAEGKSLYLFTREGNRFLMEGNLTALEERLDPKYFFRINRKFSVSFSAIVDMLYYSKSRIKVNLHPAPPEATEAIVSQDRCNDFKKWLNQ